MFENILFAVEFTNDEEKLALQKAKTIADTFSAKLSLIHVVDLPPIDIYDELFNQEDLYLQEAKGRLAEIGNQFNIPSENLYAEMGEPRTVIHEFIQKKHIDLLIMGHHERHGIYLFFGSTAEAVVAHAQCPVLILPFSGNN